MPWGRLDDGLYDHPKLDALGRSKLPAVGLWTLSISWSNRRLTDGFIPTDRVFALGATTALAETLVAAGLFDRVDDGYLIHDFLTFNDSREQVEARREADRNRKRKAAGLQPEASPETRRTPEPRAPARDRAGRVPPAAARPGPTDSSPDLGTPKSPPSGDDDGNPRAKGTNPRANGTSPRQLAAAAEAQAGELAKGRRDRVNQRQLAYLRGAITEAEQSAMNQADTPLEEIPDWAEHQAKLAAPSNWLDTL
jgi:hypothetical protein